MAYAILRYNVFGTVPLVQLPAYITNKALGMASALALLCAAVGHARSQPETLKRWAGVSFGLAAAHVMLSLALWSAEYYPKLFGFGMMNWSGEFTLLFGVLTAWLYGAMALFKPKSFQKMRVLAARLLALHCLSLGVLGWLAPAKWFGGMPPISLICFLAALFAARQFAQPAENPEPPRQGDP